MTVNVGRTCLVVADRISKVQKEIVKMMATQIVTCLQPVEIIDFYESDQLVGWLDIEEAEFVKVSEVYGVCVDWDKIYAHYRGVLDSYRNVIIINSPTFRFNNEDGIELLKEYERRVIEDPTYLINKTTGNVIKSHIQRLLFIKAAAHPYSSEDRYSKSIFQFVINPNEIDYRKLYNFKRYKRIGPTSTWENTILGPTYEYALKNTYIQKVYKTQDLCWYACNRDKPNIDDFERSVRNFVGRRHTVGGSNSPSRWWKNLLTGVHGVYDYRSIKDAMQQDEYYFNLMLSHYTVCTPTDDGSFPIVRFMEAVILGCIPLIHWDVDVKQLRLTDQYFYDIIIDKKMIIPEHHVTSYGNDSPVEIFERMNFYKGEAGDGDIVELLQKSPYYKKLTDEASVEDFYTRLMLKQKRKG